MKKMRELEISAVDIKMHLITLGTRVANKIPNVCLVLALDSWNYCFGEQGLASQHKYKIVKYFSNLKNVYD